jgi:hypothetical protein
MIEYENILFQGGCLTFGAFLGVFLSKLFDSKKYNSSSRYYFFLALYSAIVFCLVVLFMLVLKFVLEIF